GPRPLPSLAACAAEEKRREVFCRPYAYQLQISKIKLLKRLLINAKHFIRFVLPGYDLFC
ncbi:hypothetical protein LMH46_05970, partial [Neisseria gonorrhoeae]|uniref:hypothetical protein n=1 Tax=Neisseria gonorrhoeae TaxID=485 RepID=UPI001E462662